MWPQHVSSVDTMIILQKEMHEVSSNIINWMEWHVFVCLFFVCFFRVWNLNIVDTNTPQSLIGKALMRPYLGSSLQSEWILWLLHGHWEQKPNKWHGNRLTSIEDIYMFHRFSQFFLGGGSFVGLGFVKRSNLRFFLVSEMRTVVVFLFSVRSSIKYSLCPGFSPWIIPVFTQFWTCSILFDRNILTRGPVFDLSGILLHPKKTSA